MNLRAVYARAMRGLALTFVCLAACVPGGPADSPDVAPLPATAAAPTTPTTAPAPPAPPGPLDRITVICDRAVRCGTIGRSQLDECREGPGRSRLTLVWGSEEMLGVPRLVAAKRMTPVPAATRACLAYLATAPCDLDRTKTPRSCSESGGEVLAPAVPSGGACERWEECIAGHCSAQPACTGICIARSPIDGPCGNELLCTEDAFCHENRCRARAPVGAECRGHWQWCQDGLFCDGYRAANLDDHAYAPEQPGRCSAGKQVGESCVPGDAAPHDLCAAGLFCDWGVDRPVCTTPLAAGATCRSIDACADGLACAGLVLGGLHPAGRRYATRQPGRCTPVFDAGDPCDPAAFISGCPATMTCDGARRVCRSRGHAGDPCVSSWVTTPQRDDVPLQIDGCFSGHHCDVATRTCKLQLPLGAACKPVAFGKEDSPCFLGECDATTRKCAAVCGPSR